MLYINNIVTNLVKVYICHHTEHADNSSTVDYLIMHTIRPHPQPMHYEIYATQSNVTRV